MTRPQCLICCAARSERGRAWKWRCEAGRARRRRARGGAGDRPAAALLYRGPIETIRRASADRSRPRPNSLLGFSGIRAVGQTAGAQGAGPHHRRIDPAQRLRCLMRRGGAIIVPEVGGLPCTAAAGPPGPSSGVSRRPTRLSGHPRQSAEPSAPDGSFSRDPNSNARQCPAHRRGERQSPLGGRVRQTIGRSL